MKKLTKNVTLFALIAVLVLTIALCAVTSFTARADELPQVKAEDKTVHRGQRFTVKLALSNNSGLAALNLSVRFNRDVFTLVDVTRGDALPTLTFTPGGNYAAESFGLLWDGIGTPDYTNGTLITLTFDSNIAATPGLYDILVDYVPNNTLASYGKMQPITTVKGTVDLQKGEYTAIYRDWNDKVLYEKDFNEDAVPTFAGETNPSRPEDDKYVYTWTGKWLNAVAQNPNELIFVAEYSLTPQQYQLDYYIADSIDGELKLAEDYSCICDYDSQIEFAAPFKANYTFMGWYTDKAFTQKFSQNMPAHDLELYGYYKLSVRLQAPTVRLSYVGASNGLLLVDVNLEDNIGICDMKLTLQYDRNALTLVGVDKGDALASRNFHHTNVNTDLGYAYYPFTFTWTAPSLSSSNDYGNGKLLTLKFAAKANVEIKGYEVTVGYNTASDVDYVDGSGNKWMSMLNVYGCSVPIGTINSWQEVTEEGNVPIDVESTNDMPSNVQLKVEYVSDKAGVDLEDKFAAALGTSDEIKAVYGTSLVVDGVQVAPNGNLTVRIKLSQKQADCKSLKVYFVNDEGELAVKESSVQDGYVVFETDHLGRWYLTGEIQQYTPDSVTLALILVSLFALILLVYAIIVTVKAQKGKKAVNYADGGGESE